MQKKLCIYSNITTYLILACKTNSITNKTNCYNKAKYRIVFLYIPLQAGVNFDWLGLLVRHVLKGENVETKRPKPSKRKGRN
jgi:hypothetical protein